ncbi:LysM peptidoglycan-binding domain-containing protein [Paenibacillus sp. sgz500958]|uniref:LysM peptidoglycan-binding domain-containing protein n=1 Tax=Paenibacillus sp. sgz500958 TaxID=3242475 RepID=UPI0036D402F6
MFDQSHGLRFDIYERVHLPQELPGIAELEEVELIPEIQVIQREDRAELYGQLLLTGLYRSEDDRTQRLEHAIPVEITVPLTRVSSIEDIGVEIENFDIDLLTMRSVNITGVLSLRGIGGAESLPVWQQEEYTVAYSPEEERLKGINAAGEQESDALYENSLWTFGEGEVDESAEGLIVHTHSLTNEQKDDAEPESVRPAAEIWNLGAYVNERSEEPAASEVSNETYIEDVYPEKIENLENAPELMPFPAEEEVIAEEAPPVQEEKPDVKIALGSKKAAKAEDHKPMTFSALLNSSRSRKELEEAQALEAAPAAAAISSARDTEWKSRFIGGVEGADLFRKVRLCIVQREDTLDTIAEKYHLSARELGMYNRLSGQNVEEGQVLYIP